MKATDAARALGRRGGRARSARLSVDQRKQIASLGGKARSLSFHAARRIEENFRYLAAVDALHQRPVMVTRMRAFDGRLPGSIPSASHDARTSRPRRHRR